MSPLGSDLCIYVEYFIVKTHTYTHDQRFEWMNHRKRLATPDNKLSYNS